MPPVDMNFEFIKRIPGMPDQIFRSKPVAKPAKEADKIVKNKSAKDTAKAKKKGHKNVPDAKKSSKKIEEDSES